MRLDQARRKALIDLRAQVRDVGLDGARTHEALGTPNLIEELIAREDAMRIAQERDQQVVLACGQRNVPFGSRDRARLEVDLQIGVTQDLRLREPRPAQRGLET